MMTWGIGCDFKHVCDVEIEYHDKLGISILYIPDEYRSDANETWRIVLERMKLKGYDSVDFILMHGMFHYQAPAVIRHKVNIHDLDKYSSITNHLIMIGHFHVSSKNGKCIAAGSFDRLSHGEEGPKGHWRGIVRWEGESPSFTSLRTNSLSKYKTLKLHDVKEGILELVDQFVNDNPDADYRIKGIKTT